MNERRPIILKSESLKLLESSEPVQACNGVDSDSNRNEYHKYFLEAKAADYLEI
jgi:hypothetical protein